MLQRFARDESGMTMGLVVITIVLIGVMGAGLLVFVQRDLEAVVEVNQGQKAFEVADAGVQAARRQLLSDATANATTNMYDDNEANGNSPWSPVPRADAPKGGRNLAFDTNAVNVRIEYLLPSDTSSELDDADHAPELTPLKADGVSRESDYPQPTDYFKITSEGTAGDARRKIEAIYRTVDLGVPKGYYTPSPDSNSIELLGTADIKGVSVFTLGGVKIANGAKITGTDQAYGNWYNPPFNTTARPTTTEGTDSAAGIGAVGTITGSPKLPDGSPSLGQRDFDASRGFIKKDPPDSNSQTTSQRTFPFDYRTQQGQQDADRIDFLREEAKRQEAETGEQHYFGVAGSGGESLDTGDWPGGSSPNTVVFVEFVDNPSSSTLTWNVGNSCDNPPVEGTLVVKNGNFKLNQGTAPLRGVVIVRGGAYDEGDSSNAGGSTCLDGFVNATGTIKIAGSVEPLASQEVANRPGFYGVRLWSWRELYE
jgi:hypothetical protein